MNWMIVKLRYDNGMLVTHSVVKVGLDEDLAHDECDYMNEININTSVQYMVWGE